MAEVTYTLVKNHIESYKINGNDSTWAVITIDGGESYGRIQIASDYGDWQYYWSSCGAPFKKFLVELKLEYAATKFGCSRFFDHAATMAELRELLKEFFESEKPDNEDDFLEELEYLDDCGDLSHFYDTAYRTDYISKLWDTGPNIHYKNNPAFVRFWDELWPVFIKQIKLEI